MQAPGAPHEHLPEAVVRADEPILDAETPAELERPRLLGQERIGARLDEETAGALGGDGAAEPVARLEEREIELDGPLARELDRAVRRREPGDAPADDDEPQRGHVSSRRLQRRREPGRPASR